MSGRRPSPPAPPHRRSLRPRRPTGSPGPAQVRGESDSLRPSPVQTPSVSRSAASIGRRCARSTAPTAAPGSHEPPPAYRRRSTPPSGKCSGRRCNRHVATVSARWTRSARRASSCSPMSSGAGIRVGRRCTPIVAEIKHTDARPHGSAAADTRIAHARARYPGRRRPPRLTPRANPSRSWRGRLLISGIGDPGPLLGYGGTQDGPPSGHHAHWCTIFPSEVT